MAEPGYLPPWDCRTCDKVPGVDPDHPACRFGKGLSCVNGDDCENPHHRSGEVRIRRVEDCPSL